MTSGLGGSEGKRPRILFVSEAVTLAHVARPLVLAAALDPTRWDIIVACDRRYAHFTTDSRWQEVALESISSDRFMRALSRGAPVYDAATLERYVQDDLALIDRVRPDLIVGDFRLSLSVSARLAGVRYAAITNAYWSPQYRGVAYPLPVFPWTRRMPLAAAKAMFDLFRPLALRSHVAPLNRLRVKHGLPALGHDLRRVYTDADDVFYADAPTQFSVDRLPSNHRFIGPLLWSPPGALPEWWSALPRELPIIYLTLGSSGAAADLWRVVQALQDLPAVFLVSTSGSTIPSGLPENIKVEPYLPGGAVSARAQLVICNGGSLTSQQALVSGVPVLGIASNMDQFLNMQSIVAAGAGVLQRADRLNAASLREVVGRMLIDGNSWRVAARRLGAELSAIPAGQAFAAWADDARASQA